MIILVSKDFLPLAHALQALYAEPLIELIENPIWLRNLPVDNHSKFITRLTIIGHGDTLYSNDQAYFGGNQHEKIMLIEEFVHRLLDMLKYNERVKPGFCRHLKVIDIIDCHQGKQQWIAQDIAERLHDDPYIRDYASHIRINSFVNEHNPRAGCILMLHPKEKQTLSFYTFDAIKTYKQYKEGHAMLDKQKTALHHLLKLPKHTPSANGQEREAAIVALQSQCDAIQKKEHDLLKSHTNRHLHISDPRQYLDKHRACQITVDNATSSAPKKTKHSAHVSKSMFSVYHPRVPHHKHTHYLDGDTFEPAHSIDEEQFSGQMKHRKQK